MSQRNSSSCHLHYLCALFSLYLASNVIWTQLCYTIEVQKPTFLETNINLIFIRI